MSSACMTALFKNNPIRPITWTYNPYIELHST